MFKDNKRSFKFNPKSEKDVKALEAHLKDVKITSSDKLNIATDYKSLRDEINQVIDPNSVLPSEQYMKDIHDPAVTIKRVQVDHIVNSEYHSGVDSFTLKGDIQPKSENLSTFSNVFSRAKQLNGNNKLAARLESGAFKFVGIKYSEANNLPLAINYYLTMFKDNTGNYKSVNLSKDPLIGEIDRVVRAYTENLPAVERANLKALDLRVVVKVNSNNDTDVKVLSNGLDNLTNVIL